jgi:hypothetical protein
MKLKAFSDSFLACLRIEIVSLPEPETNVEQTTPEPQLNGNNHHHLSMISNVANQAICDQKDVLC